MKKLIVPAIMAFQDGEWVINQIEPGFEQFVLRVQFGIYFREITAGLPRSDLPEIFSPIRFASLCVNRV